MQPEGNGNPANMNGRVETGGPACAWLNASNAPWWFEIEAAYRSNAIGLERWATTWCIDIIHAAVADRPSLRRLR